MSERPGYYRSTETRPEEEEEHGAGAGYHHPGYVGEGPEGRMQGRGVEVIPTSAAGFQGEGPYRGRGPRGYQRSPERIFTDVCDRLMESPWVDASHIEVRAEGADILLEGTVHDARERALAADLVADVLGVARVRNHLKLRA